jgi:Mg-chelatase subunit ChlD
VTSRPHKRFVALALCAASISSSCGGESPYAERALAASPNPIYIVLDTSASMADEVGYEPKIESAQRAVQSLIESVDRSTDIALRSYPGSMADDECSEGQIELPFALYGSDESSSVVTSLYPWGDTPTAEALSAAASDIMSMGQPTSLVLVSDGESNCSPPCDIARQLSTQVDWNVVVIGFDVSGGAAGELQCIADATGGRYLTVDDGDELETLFADPEELFSVGG